MLHLRQLSNGVNGTSLAKYSGAVLVFALLLAFEPHIHDDSVHWAGHEELQLRKLLHIVSRTVFVLLWLTTAKWYHISILCIDCVKSSSVWGHCCSGQQWSWSMAL